MNKLLYTLSVIFALIGCKNSDNPDLQFSRSNSVPLCTNCQSPNIHKVSSDKSLITYIQSDDNEQDALVMHAIKKGEVSAPRTIASGNNWFVNWADIPSIVSLDASGTNLMAHWLQMSAEGTYDYDIRCAISKNGGSSWAKSFVLHDDSISAEHGFVTMISTPNGAFVTWLDGRNTKTPAPHQKTEKNDEHDHGHIHNMPMTLRGAWIDQEGKKYNDFEIDDKVCDCCQTDAVMTSSGPVIVYRDRSDEEIRDISIARYIDKKWTHKTLHQDNWEVAGCPVNGPAAAYQGGILAIAWYTQMNKIPKVFLTISRDDGNTFGDPLLLAEDRVLGRVDVAIDRNKNVVTTWMKDAEKEAYLNSRIYSNRISQLGDTQKLLATKRERRVGFPIIEFSEHGLIMVRTKIQNGELAIVLETFNDV